VVNVFARELTDDLASLVKQLDEVVGKNEEKKAAGFVVLLSEDPDADESKVQAFAEKHEIKHLPLTIFDGVAGPPNYKLAQEADVTVLLWVNQEVKANHAFGKGELNASAAKQVVADTAKILE
jgi:hypothetical protein